MEGDHSTDYAPLSPEKVFLRPPHPPIKFISSYMIIVYIYLNMYLYTFV